MLRLRAAALLVSILLVAGSAVGAGASPAGPGADGEILAQEVFRFPAYAEAPADVRRFHTQEAYERAAADPRYELVRLSYRSDGLRVAAYLYKPRETAGLRAPLVVYNRGSYLVQDLEALLAPVFHRLAEAGFVVLAPLYRESAGGEGRDEVGGADLADLMNVIPLARSLGYADLDNVFRYGVSRGGMMVFQAIRDGFPARAAATVGAFTDLGALMQEHPGVYGPLAAKLWPTFERDRAQILARRSALAWPEKLGAPLLLLHGGADESVDPAQTLRLALRLQELGRPYELAVYAGDDHTLSRHEEERDRRIVEWFKAHQAAGPGG